MKPNDAQVVGLIIFAVSIMAMSYIIGVFYEHQLVVNLLFVMYLFGIGTVVGLMLIDTNTKEKRKYVRKEKKTTRD